MFGTAAFSQEPSTPSNTDIAMTNESQPIEAELFAELPQAVGNITSTPTGEVIYSHHPFFEPDVRVARLNADRRTFEPFPNLSWNTPREGDDRYLDSVLGLRGDENGVVWMLDMGNRTGITPKIVGWNTWHNRLERIYYIPAPASRPESQHNDLIVNNKDGVFVIADEGIGEGGDGTQAALVVVDMETGATRRLLEGHVSTLPEDVAITVDGNVLMDGDTGPLRIGADGIAADKDFDWLYFGPLSGTSLYRVRFDDLLNEELDEEELGERVERYAEKSINGGLSMDQEGNVYSTMVESREVGIITPDERRNRVFARSDDMVWPDGVSFGIDGYMYVSAAQVSRAAAFNDGNGNNAPPYRIFRFKPEAPGRIGH
ncbi:MAG: L-dopachrome tautomerase-related protein [Pseudomonadota bacterium]|nr:L-dopachrome tautomerase-related protein [Pseudomonadota bacterium]